MKRSVKTPHAAVVVYNYDHRLGTESVSDADVNSVSEVIISSMSVTSITTSKGKENSVGSFQINLAPTRNWISTLTAGSWVVIMMSQSPITEADVRNKANPKKVKLLGRIESVRTQTSVDPTTGAVSTSYVVHGTDWCSFMQSQILIDPYLSPSSDPNNIGSATTFLIIQELFQNGGRQAIHKIDEQLAALISIFGMPLNKALSNTGRSTNRVVEVKYSFRLPDKLAKYFGFVKQGAVANDTLIANMLELISGKLVDTDKYQPTNESMGIVNFAAMRGAFSLWQILQEHANPALNELLADIRWTDAGPTLAIYNRIKPFAITSAVNSNPLASKFSFVKRHLIKLEDVISFEAGTNWRDKYNMAEIRFDTGSLAPKDWENGILTRNQISDTAAFQREGLRARIDTTRAFPADSYVPSTGKYDPFSGIENWVKLHKEWYFNTHRLLNGTIVFAGQDDYIQIGDNILVDAKVLGSSKKINTKGKTDSYLLLHVENIRHSFSVDERGARTYFTTIDFVRGLITDQNGNVAAESLLDESVVGLNTPAKNDDDTPQGVIVTKTNKGVVK